MLCMCVALPASAKTPDPYPPIDEPLHVQRVAGTDVYYVLGHPAVPAQRNEGFTSNAGFVVTKAGTVVFDTLGTPSLGYALLQAIRKTTDQPIRYVILSHYHADHIYGLQAFKDHTDAIIIAQQKAYDYIHSLTATQRMAQRRQALAPWVNENTRVVAPDITFSDKLTLKLGGVDFRLIYAGPAHSPSDIMMMVEPGGVLFAGDIVQNHRIPAMDGPDVNTANWLKGLATVRKLNPRFIIPGHGDPSDNAISAIDFTHGYLVYVRTQMKKAADEWENFDTAYQQTDWSQYYSLPAFNAVNKRNAYRVYLDMEQALTQ
ncbi:MAG TPA: MBL fold metallo-hydrolase [Burkholderiales bacterium]|nr:MBL fold metallo-hydrolase [Burkholderiales bacterium]